MVDYVCCENCGKMVYSHKTHKVGKYIVCYACKDTPIEIIKKNFSKNP